MEALDIACYIVIMSSSPKKKKPHAARKQGRDLNVLKSLTGHGTKLVEKVVEDKKKSIKPKHKKDIFPEDE